MKVLHLTPYYAPAYSFGGVVRAVEGMARALVRRGHTVTILTTDALDLDSRYDGPAEELRDGVRVLHASNVSRRLRGHLNLSTPSKMQAIAREILPDVDLIHCHEFRTVENLLVTPVAVEMDKPLLLSPHGTLNPATGRSHLKIAWDTVLSPAVAQRFDHVIGLTHQEIAEAKKLWGGFGPRRVPTGFSVIPNGIDLDEYARLDGGAWIRERFSLGDGPVCLFMGRLHERKGLRVLVQAFRQITDPAARLLIVGPDEGALAQIQPLLDERTIVTGFLDGADRLAAFAAADFFVLPAVGEGLPMVVLEAMGAGLPVIISPGCYLPEVAMHGAGLVVEPELAPLAAALKQLFSDSALRHNLGVNGPALIAERFTWDAVALQLEPLYESLLAVTSSNA